MSVAERLESLRKPEGESDTAFAKRAGIWVTTLQGILRGNEPKDRTLQTIAEHLGCTAVYLRYGIGEAPTTNTKQTGAANYA
jgi:transcriptional regulator with XRE-family HTH domain